MKRASLFLALLTGGMIVSAAHAASWADYETAFPLFPCGDGWVACRVDGSANTPDMQEDSTGMPVPSSWRIGWFDLSPTDGFSPFSTLSEYTGEAPPGMDGGDEVAEDPTPEPSGEASEAAARAEESRLAAEEAESVAAAEAERAQQAREDAVREAEEQAAEAARLEAAAAAASAEDRARIEEEAAAARQAAADAAAAQAAAERAEAERQADADRIAAEAEAARVAALAAEAEAEAERLRLAEEERKRLEDEPTAEADPGPPETELGDCSQLVSLEPQALMGKLSDGQVAGCEARIAAAEKQTDKDKVSRLLMTNAYSKGDQKGWEKLVKRHLNEIDRSDPTLCLKYAQKLYKKGSGGAPGAIKWADVALDNRTVWTGDTYTKYVNALHKLKSGAAQKLWKKAAETHASSPSAQTQGEIDTWRNNTKVYSREWYEYAKSAGKDSSVALQLCMQAAGTADYCEGGG